MATQSEPSGSSHLMGVCTPDRKSKLVEISINCVRNHVSIQRFILVVERT